MIKCLQKLTELIWPRGLQCLTCGELSGGKLLCPACAKALSEMKLPPEEAGDGPIRSVYQYDGVAKELVLHLKEDGLGDAATVLARGMAEAIRTMNIPDGAVLTWVTMPPQRRRKRWIDHGRQLCEEVARQTGLPARQLLDRRGNLHTQRGLGREARLRNLTGSFICNEHIASPVILVDDVLTTGATVTAVSEALKAAGAPCVYAVTATKVIIAR
ncbi:MAG: phosphoribosyltransferase family protein [Clostridiales bacterium]|nr:phosphoribosyltransferase family protein [Clostridiales bacterium]